MLADQILDSKGRQVATVTQETTIADAVAALAEHNVGALVVSSDGETLEGIISERDIVRRMATEGAAVLHLTARDLMKTEVATCDGHANTATIMNVMTAGRFRHMPVIKNGKLDGIISIGDVVKVRIGELAQEAEQLVDYIRTGR